MNTIASGQASKAIVALLGAATTLLTHWAGAWWEPAAATAVTVIAVYLVPNAPPSAVPLPPVVPPAA